MDTLLLYYHIYKGTVSPVNYINWAINMLEKGCSSHSLNILASLREPHNIFEVEDYFRRALKELDMDEPSYEECAAYYIRHLSKNILENENKAIDLAYEIYLVVRDLEYKENLEEWYNISDQIDDFLYGDNFSNLSKEDIISIIKKEAKAQLRRSYNSESAVIAKTLKKVEEDIKNDNLGKARDRLHGLISTFPNKLELRKKLGDIYFELKYPAMAGRYWYLVENKSAKMIKACNEFEKSMGNDPNNIVRALKYKGDKDMLTRLELEPTILTLLQIVNEKRCEEPDDSSKGNYNWVIFGCFSIVILISIFAIVGVYAFINWLF